MRVESEARGEDGRVVGAAGDGDEGVGRLVEARTVEGADGTGADCEERGVSQVGESGGRRVPIRMCTGGLDMVARARLELGRKREARLVGREEGRGRELFQA